MGATLTFLSLLSCLLCWEGYRSDLAKVYQPGNTTQKM
jgi:hypothetical protein